MLSVQSWFGLITSFTFYMLPTFWGCEYWVTPVTQWPESYHQLGEQPWLSWTVQLICRQLLPYSLEVLWSFQIGFAAKSYICVAPLKLLATSPVKSASPVSFGLSLDCSKKQSNGDSAWWKSVSAFAGTAHWRWLAPLTCNFWWCFLRSLSIEKCCLCAKARTKKGVVLFQKLGIAIDKKKLASVIDITLF